MGDGLTLAVVAIVGIWVWHWSSSARERVLAISAEICRDLKLQRLGDTVALRRITASVTGGRLIIRRIYSFDFSTTGEDRRRAEICLTRAAVQWVRIDHPEGPILMQVSDRGGLA